MIIGLGYVGLLLAIEFERKYKVLGFDIDISRVSELNNGENRTFEADLVVMQPVMVGSSFTGLTFSSNTDDLEDFSIFVVSD